MKSHFILVFQLFLLFQSLFFLGCVSIPNIKQEVIHSKEVTFLEPAKPFEPISAKNSDKIWLSGKTGNTISYYSECFNSADPNLDQILKDITQSMSDSEIIESTDLVFSERASKMTTVKGTVDGVPVKIKALIFKKNSCNYSLLYAGVSKTFTTEINYFDLFIQNFYIRQK